MKEHKCQNCNKAFKSYEKTPKYCCRECYKKGHTVWNKGKKLHYPVWNKGKKSWQKREKHPNWKGGKWCWAKKFVLDRDNGTCQYCKLQEREIMDIAHIKGHEVKGQDRRYIVHNPAHLITLCPNCHRRYDNNKIKLR